MSQVVEPARLVVLALLVLATAVAVASSGAGWAAAAGVGALVVLSFGSGAAIVGALPEKQRRTERPQVAAGFLLVLTAFVLVVVRSSALLPWLSVMGTATYLGWTSRLRAPGRTSR